ncbi:MAG: efflux RND transporter periplasmic adaptor subunit [Aeoliella sp.]
MSTQVEQEANDKSAQAEPQKKGPSPKLIAVVAIAVAAGAYFYLSGKGKIATDDAQAYGHQHSIAPEVSGRVLEVLVDDNAMVKQGDVLVRLDDSTYKATVADATATLAKAQSERDAAAEDLGVFKVTTVENLNQAEAAFTTAQANEVSAQLGVEIAQSAVDASTANVESAVATLSLREFQKEQIAKAVAENPGAASLDRVKQSETDFDSATAAKAASAADLTQAEKALGTKQQDLEAAEQAVVVAQASLEKARTGPEQVKAAEAKLAAAEAAVQAAEAQVDLAELNLSYCTVIAPADGQVAKKSVEIGNYLMPGTPVMTIVDVNTIWVLANYKETQLQDIRPGQRVEMKSDIYPNWTFEGTVDSVDSGTGAAFGLFPPQNATGNYVKIVQRVPVKVVIPDDQRDSNRPLKIGMNIVATTYTTDGE